MNPEPTVMDMYMKGGVFSCAIEQVTEALSEKGILEKVTMDEFMYLTYLKFKHLINES